MITLLDRRTGNGAVGAEYAADAFFGFEQGTAGFAIVIPLAGIRGHGFGFPVATFRAGNYRLQDDRFTHRPLTFTYWPAYCICSLGAIDYSCSICTNN